MKKLLSVVVVLAMMLSIGAVQVLAAGEGQQIAYSEKESTEVIADFNDMTKVTGTWDNGIARVFDGTKLVISNDVSGNITGLTVTGVEPGVYKVGYFMEIKAIKDSDNPPEDDSDTNGMQDWRFRLNPYGTYVNMPYYPCDWNGLEFEGLSTVVGQKIIGVAVIKVTETSDIELLSWPLNGYMDATLDRIVFAGADHDFGPANYPDYTIFYEGAPHEGDAAKVEVEDEYTESNLNAPAGDGEDDKKDDETTATPDDKNESTDDKKEDSTTTPKTADVSVVLAMVAAGAAALGGLKLRKK